MAKKSSSNEDEEKKDFIKVKIKRKNWDKAVIIFVPIVRVDKDQRIKRPDWHRKVYGDGGEW